MLYKLTGRYTGSDGPAAFGFDGEYSIIVADFDVNGREGQVGVSVGRVRAALEDAGGFKFR
jgi:hypothetical protein